MKEYMTNFYVSNVPADGLVPLGAGTSAGKVMTKFASRTNTRPVFKGLNQRRYIDLW